MKNLVKRLLAAAASAVMCAVLVAPASVVNAEAAAAKFGKALTPEASDANQITLNPREGVDAPTGAEFGAYQIFAGTADTSGEPLKDPGDTNKPAPLSSITFGNAFGATDDAIETNAVNFVIALAKAEKGIEPYDEYKYAFSDFTGFDGLVDENATALNDSFYEGGKVKLDDLAEALAGVVADKANANHEWLGEFCDVALGFGGTDEAEFDVPGFVKYYYAFSDADGDGSWTVNLGENGGYYMVVDMSTIAEGAEDQAYSARMLLVAGKVEQQLKESVPKLEKNILSNDDQTTSKSEYAGVGDVVKFDLRGTLPSNYPLFVDGYQYNFVDKLSEGLTVNKDTIEVWANGVWQTTPEGEKTWYTTPMPIGEGDVADALGEELPHINDSKAYKIVYPDDPENKEKGTLRIEFPCLKEILIRDEAGNSYTLGCNDDRETVSEIIVTYTATVNGDAVIRNGNENSAYVEYSDNPQSYDDTDKTTPDNATVYTFGLELEKVDGSDLLNQAVTDNGKLTKLDGVEFALLRAGTEKDTYEIATFKTEEKTSLADDPFAGEEYYSITNWTALEETVTAENSLQDVVDTYLATGDAGTHDTQKAATETGKLRLSGLAADITYTLVEVTVPKDFAKADPFTVTLKSQKDANGGYVNGGMTLELNDDQTFGGKDADGKDIPLSFTHFLQNVTTDTIDSVAEGGGVMTDGSGDLLVANFQYKDLPSTGGVGTWVFYVLGVGGLCLSAFLFASARRKRDAA